MVGDLGYFVEQIFDVGVEVADYLGFGHTSFVLGVGSAFLRFGPKCVHRNFNVIFIVSKI